MNEVRPHDEANAQDLIWLRLVAAGGRDAERAMEGLFRRYRRPLLAFLMQRGLDDGVAEDVVQDVFIRVGRAAASFRQEAKVSTWLFQIAKNLCTDLQRKTNLEDTVDEDAWMAIEATVAAPPLCGASKSVGQSLEECFEAGFTEFARSYPQAADVLHKVVRLGWDTSDVASFLQRTNGATREYLSQCRKKLKRFVEPCLPLLGDP